MKLLFLFLFSTVAFSQDKQVTIENLGDKCQVCIITKTTKICRFYDKCPVKKD